MPRLGNPFPIRPNTIPVNQCIRRHGAIGQEIIITHPAIRFHDARIVEAIPGVIFIQPASNHGARAVQVAPRARTLFPTRKHRARVIEAIPRPRDRTPSRRHSAVRAKPIPRRTIAVPARLHRSAVIEEIPLAIDFAPTSRHCAVGIDHSKVPIALDKNRIHVFKRQNINAGTAARLAGLRQSDIRAKKERWRTSTRQRTTSRRAASLASKSKHPLSYFLQRWPSACLNGSSIIVGALQNIRHGQLC